MKLQPAYLAGALWMMFAGLLFVAVAITVRLLGSDMPAVEAAFIRYLFGLLLVAPVIFRMSWRRVIRRQTLLPYLLRGLAHGAAVLLWFFAMARISIAEVTAIGYTAPLFTTIGAVLVFSERIHLRRMIALAVGFIGVVVILRPGFTEVSIGAIAQFVAAPCFAISFLFAKRLTRTEDPSDIIVMLTIFCTLTLLPGAVAVWQTPTPTELMWLLLTAVFATVGHYALTRAFACAPLTATQPFSYLQLVWAVLFGYLFFTEVPDIWVMLGGGIIVASVTYLMHREALARRIGAAD